MSEVNVNPSSAAPGIVTPPVETVTPSPTPSLVTEPTAAVDPVEPKVEPAAEPAPFVPLTAAELSFPEGHTVDETLQSEFLETINNQEMTPAERANALINLQGKVLTQASEANSAAWDTMQSEWQAEVKTAYGDKLTPTMESVAKLVEEYGSPELKQVFDMTGAGNNLHMVKFLHTLSEKLTEGGGPLPGVAATTISAAQRMYPSMKA